MSCRTKSLYTAPHHISESQVGYLGSSGTEPVAGTAGEGMLILRGPLRYHVEKAVELSDRHVMISQCRINFF